MRKNLFPYINAYRTWKQKKKKIKNVILKFSLGHIFLLKGWKLSIFHKSSTLKMVCVWGFLYSDPYSPYPSQLKSHYFIKRESLNLLYSVIKEIKLNNLTKSLEMLGVSIFSKIYCLIYTSAMQFNLSFDILPLRYIFTLFKIFLQKSLKSVWSKNL